MASNTVSIISIIFLLICGCAEKTWQQTHQIKKHPGEFAAVAKLYQKLLDQSQGWVLRRQIREDVSPEEKAIVLVSYKEGQITVLDWLMAIHAIKPPDRPRDLNTVQGVEKFLDGHILADESTFQQRIAAKSGYID